MEFYGTKSLVYSCLYRFCYLYPTGIFLFLKFPLHYVVVARCQEQHNNSLPVPGFGAHICPYPENSSTFSSPSLEHGREIEYSIFTVNI